MAKVKFGDVVRECKGKIDQRNNPYEFYVAGDHMDTDDLSIRRRGRFSTDDVGPAFIRTFRKGQVLYGSRRTYLRKIAVADFDGVTANTTFVLETKDEGVLRQRLLPFIMYTESFTEWSIKKSKGSTNPYVLFKDLADYEFDLPDIEKQDELVELLWSMNDTKDAYVNLIASIDELVKSRFVEMFGDPGQQKEKLTTLGKHINLMNGYAFKGDRFRESGIPVIKIGNVNRADFSTGSMQFYDSEIDLERFIVRQGDLLISLTGTVGKEDFGNVCLVDGDYESYYLNQRNAKLDVHKELHPVYLLHLLRNEYVRKKLIQAGTGVRQCHLHNRDIEYLEFFLPPLALQNRFAAFVESTDKSKFELRKALTEMIALYKRIIQDNLV